MSELLYTKANVALLTCTALMTSEDSEVNIFQSLLFFSGIHSQTHPQGSNAFLICEHNGKVIWSKGVDGQRADILTAQQGEGTIKHKPDPDLRYSVLSDLELFMRNLSLSDSGIYYCNAVPVVNLTVTPLQGEFTVALPHSYY